MNERSGALCDFLNASHSLYHAQAYLMDVLQYSGIDFQSADRPVYLEINGRACSFRDVLREQDVVTIRLG